jgi:hypothetical protein
MSIRPLRFSAISPRRKQLVRMCQALNFGVISGIRLECGDPMLTAATMLVEDRLDLPEESRSEVRLDEFNLSKEWRRLLSRFDEIQDGTIERLEVRAGLPRRILAQARIPDAQQTY